VILDSRYFGSFVRGDLDEFSDVDVLAVTQSWSQADERELLSQLPKDLRSRASIAWYSPSKLQEMIRGGDLFAWHLYQESEPTGIHPDWLSSVFPPAPYTQAKQTVGVFNDLLRSIGEELSGETASDIYEAGLLFSAARNIAMAASSRSTAGLQFSRFSPYRLPEVPLSNWLEIDTYKRLIAARFAGQRGNREPKILHNELISAHRAISGWVRDVQRELFKGD
jgi:hypothetical protein